MILIKSKNDSLSMLKLPIIVVENIYEIDFCINCEEPYSINDQGICFFYDSSGSLVEIEAIYPIIIFECPYEVKETKSENYYFNFQQSHLKPKVFRSINETVLFWKDLKGVLKVTQSNFSYLIKNNELVGIIIPSH